MSPIRLTHSAMAHDNSLNKVFLLAFFLGCCGNVLALGSDLITPTSPSNPVVLPANAQLYPLNPYIDGASFSTQIVYLTYSSVYYSQASASFVQFDALPQGACNRPWSMWAGTTGFAATKNDAAVVCEQDASGNCHMEANGLRTTKLFVTLWLGAGLDCGDIRLSVVDSPAPFVVLREPHSFENVYLPGESVHVSWEPMPGLHNGSLLLSLWHRNHDSPTGDDELGSITVQFHGGSVDFPALDRNLPDGILFFTLQREYPLPSESVNRGPWFQIANSPPFNTLDGMIPSLGRLVSLRMYRCTPRVRFCDARCACVVPCCIGHMLYIATIMTDHHVCAMFAIHRHYCGSNQRRLRLHDCRLPYSSSGQFGRVLTAATRVHQSGGVDGKWR